MTAPVPEESNEAIDLTEAPDDEHASEAPGGGSGGGDDQAAEAAEAAREENAETSLDQPSS